jgi:c-di-GMP-binding flagellar brake protein YcgR
MLPLKEGTCPEISVKVKAKEKTSLKTEFRISSKSFNHTPDVVIDTTEHHIEKGEQDITIKYSKPIPQTLKRSSRRRRKRLPSRAFILPAQTGLRLRKALRWASRRIPQTRRIRK